MLRFWPILALSLMLLETPKPFPKDRSAASRNASNESKSRDQIADPANPLGLYSDTNKSVSSQASSSAAPQNQHNVVKVTELPSISLVDKNKTVWDHIFDWGPWIFNLFLVIVGALQVLLLHRTFGAIKRQANTMDKASDLLIDEKRARLHVELFPTDLPCLTVGYQREMTDGGEHFAPHCLESDEFKISIRNEGSTSAYNTSAFIGVDVVSRQSKESLLNHQETQTLSVIKADSQIFASIELFPGIEQAILDRIHSGEAFIRFFGFVRYADAFRKDRTTAFEYSWELQEFDVDDSMWVSEIQLTTITNQMT